MTQAKGGRLSQQAAMCCYDKRFWAFLSDKVSGPQDAPLVSPHGAYIVLKEWLSISSRAELDRNEAAAARWNALHAEFLAKNQTTDVEPQP